MTGGLEAIFLRMVRPTVDWVVDLTIKIRREMRDTHEFQLAHPVDAGSSNRKRVAMFKPLAVALTLIIVGMLVAFIWKNHHKPTIALVTSQQLSVGSVAKQFQVWNQVSQQSPETAKKPLPKPSQTKPKVESATGYSAVEAHPSQAAKIVTVSAPVSIQATAQCSAASLVGDAIVGDNCGSTAVPREIVAYHPGGGKTTTSFDGGFSVRPDHSTIPIFEDLQRLADLHDNAGVIHLVEKTRQTDPDWPTLDLYEAVAEVNLCKLVDAKASLKKFVGEVKDAREYEWMSRQAHEFQRKLNDKDVEFAGLCPTTNVFDWK